MAKNNTQQPFSTPAVDPNAYLRQDDVRLQDISIVTQSNPEGVSIMNQYAICQISEDIFQNNISGIISGIDASSVVTNLPLTGQEYVLLSFHTPSTGKEIELFFIIDKITDRIPLKNKQSQIYDIHFICPTFTIGLFSSVNKSYNNQTISNIVDDIYTNFINPSSYDTVESSENGKQLITNENTNGEQNIIIPNWQPFLAINWLAKRAASTSNPKIANYVFYQDLSGFHFCSLSSFFQKNVVKTYTYGVDNANDFIRDHPNLEVNVESSFTHIRKLIISGFDRSREIYRGTYASSMLVHDIVNKSYTVQNYNYLKEFSELPSLNPSPILPQKANIFSTKPSSKEYFVPTHTNMYGVPNDVKFNSGNEGVENWMQRHDAQISQLLSNSIEILVAGDSTRRVGDKISAIINSFEGTDENGRGKLDYSATGNYIVTKITHNISKTKGHTLLMKLCKESNVEPTPDYTIFDSGNASSVESVLS